MSSELCPQCNHYIYWHHEIQVGKALDLWYRYTGKERPPVKMRCCALIWDDPATDCECTIDKFILDVKK